MNNISGTLYSYFYLCKRKVWLFYHRISYEQESDFVKVGKIIDENTYARTRKHIHVDDFCVIDSFQNQVVCEVKKSDRQEAMAVAQVKYYLYVLKGKGIATVGKISYPTQHKTTDVELTAEDIMEIENNLQIITDVCNGTIPTAKRCGVCNACAYFEFCFAE